MVGSSDAYVRRRRGRHLRARLACEDVPARLVDVAVAVYRWRKWEHLRINIDAERETMAAEFEARKARRDARDAAMEERKKGLNWLGLQGTAPGKAAIFSFTMEGAARMRMTSRPFSTRRAWRCARAIIVQTR